MGFSHYVAGNLSSAIEETQSSIAVSADPFYATAGKSLLAICYILSDHLQEAEGIVNEILAFSRESGCEVWGTPALMYLGIISTAKGHMSEGLKMIEDARQVFQKNERKWYLARTECILGKIYLQMVEGAKPINLSTMVKNIGFLVKSVPFAGKRAEDHLNKAIKTAKEIGANGILGEAYLELGLLHRAKGKGEQAMECISEAITLFEQCEADGFLKHAKEALASLE
jgi:tetratricopeptide (TPR) repeat protein